MLARMAKIGYNNLQFGHYDVANLTSHQQANIPVSSELREVSVTCTSAGSKSKISGTLVTRRLSSN
jgi:hypothetical protein